MGRKRFSVMDAVGAENMFPFRSELRWKTLFGVWRYFIRSLALLRSKFGVTSYKVTGLLRTNE